MDADGGDISAPAFDTATELSTLFVKRENSIELDVKVTQAF